MRRRRKTTERVNQDRWLVSYADLVTLLFAFFVVLYSTSTMDKQKVVRIAASIQSAFQQLGVFSDKSSLPSAAAAPPLSTLAQSADAGDLHGDVHLVESALNPPDAYAHNGINVQELTRDLKKELVKEMENREVDMRLQPDGLVISLRENGFFESGDTTLLPGAQATLTRITKVLGDRGYEIRVEGHTDNRPIRDGTRFKSNWELSSERATEVVLLLISQNGFDPKKVSVAGYSEYRPIAPNDTEEGRRMNRRVDLVVVAMPSRSRASSAVPVH